MYLRKTCKSPLGEITLACDSGGENLIGLWIKGQKYHGAHVFEETTEKNDVPLFDTVESWLEGYFEGKNPKLTNIPLAPIGGEFRQEVWKILCEIPYGQVVTYGDIASQMAIKLGKPKMSSQAVGGAVGHNPISIIIPCHRVVGSNGSLTGYAAGVQIKKKLLIHEGVDMSQLFVPEKGSAI